MAMNGRTLCTALGTCALLATVYAVTIGAGESSEGQAPAQEAFMNKKTTGILSGNPSADSVEPRPGYTVIDLPPGADVDVVYDGETLSMQDKDKNVFVHIGPPTEQ